ncbi:hypothetical protein U1Q18_036641, partial [Sarracenia purpurea var. burkii]
LEFQISQHVLKNNTHLDPHMNLKRLRWTRRHMGVNSIILQKKRAARYYNQSAKYKSFDGEHLVLKMALPMGIKSPTDHSKSRVLKSRSLLAKEFKYQTTIKLQNAL